MTKDNSPVTEDELHAYVDGELPAERQEAVKDWLASHPEAANLVASWRSQAESIRARYGAVANESVPERLKLARLSQRGRSWAALAVAASLAAFLIGGATGWMARGASATATSQADALTSEAIGAHRLYIGEVRHPIEVGATEAHLLPWLSRRVGTALRTPQLDEFGLKLLGGRLLPGIAGPAALFMYESANGERYTVYCSKLDAPDTALRYSEVSPVASVYWIEKAYGYVVSGPANQAKLKEIAKSAYEQMEKAEANKQTSLPAWLYFLRGS